MKKTFKEICVYLYKNYIYKYLSIGVKAFSLIEIMIYLLISILVFYAGKIITIKVKCSMIGSYIEVMQMDKGSIEKIKIYGCDIDKNGDQIKIKTDSKDLTISLKSKFAEDKSITIED
jgi:hypothetical protein